MEVSVQIKEWQWHEISPIEKRTNEFWGGFFKIGDQISIKPTSWLPVSKITFLQKPGKTMRQISKYTYLCKGEIVGGYTAFGSGYLVIDCGILIRIALLASSTLEGEQICFRKGNYVSVELEIEGDLCDDWEGSIKNYIHGNVLKIEKANEYNDALVTLKITKIDPFTYDNYYTTARGAKRLDKDPEICVKNSELRQR